MQFIANNLFTAKFVPCFVAGFENTFVFIWHVFLKKKMMLVRGQTNFPFHTNVGTPLVPRTNIYSKCNNNS